MEREILAIYNLADIDSITTKVGDSPTIAEMYASITALSEAVIPFDSTFYNTNQAMLDEVTRQAFLELINATVAEIEVNEFAVDAPSASTIAIDGGFNDFVRKLSYFMTSSTNYIERINFYTTYKSQFMSPTSETITLGGSDSSSKTGSSSSTGKYNNTPQELGDFEGDGYANEVTTSNSSDSASSTIRYGKTSTHTKNENIAKRINEADKAIKNIYIEWLRYFRNVCLLD